MTKLVVAGVLLAHGIGHILGPLQVLKVAVVNPQWSGDSWLLSGMAGTTISNFVGVVLWSLALAGFAALAGVVVGWVPAAWWQPIAIASALLSLLGLVLFPTAFPTFSTLGALAVDVAVLASVLWFHWSPDSLAS